MWQFIVLYVLTLAYAISKIPKPQDQPEAGVNQLEAPTAEEGKEIPVLFGTCEIKGWNWVWWGDYKAEAVKKKGGKK